MSQAVSTLTPYRHRIRPLRLRELGVYELPDGTQYVVSTLYSDGCSLYPLRAWGSYGNAEFWADKVRRNRERDRETDEVLISRGWLGVRVWEHEVGRPSQVPQRPPVDEVPETEAVHGTPQG